MTELQRKSIQQQQIQIQSEPIILNTQIITIPNNIHFSQDKDAVQCNEDDAFKKESTADKRFWNKLRMIKVYQNCRFCNKTNNILNGIHFSIPGSFHKSTQQYNNSNFHPFYKLSQMMDCQKMRLLHKRLQKQEQKNYIVNYVVKGESVKKLKNLSQYYKYYQYIPLTPLSKKENLQQQQGQRNAFQVVHNYLNKKIVIFYNRIKQILVDKNSQDSLEIFNQSSDMHQSDTYLELVNSKKQVTMHVYNSSQKSQESVRDLICQIGDSTNVIKSSAKSSFREKTQKRNKNILQNQYISSTDNRVNSKQANLKKSCSSHQNSQKKSNKRKVIKSKRHKSIQRIQKLGQTYNIKYKTLPMNILNQEDDKIKQQKKLRMSTNISSKKLKKKIIRNSCDNLLANAKGSKKKTKEKINQIKVNFKSYQINEDDNIQVQRREEQKLKNYILNLKKKINIDKERLKQPLNSDNNESATKQFKLDREKSSSARRNKTNQSKQALSCETKNPIQRQYESKVGQKGNIKAGIGSSKKRDQPWSGDGKRTKIGVRYNQAQNTKLKQGQRNKKQQKQEKRSKIKKIIKRSGQEVPQAQNKKMGTTQQKQPLREKTKHSKIKRDKSNIYNTYNTRIHSSITTQMDI